MGMLDSDATCHYTLASKQLPIHKWLTQNCMNDFRFDDEAGANTKTWGDALITTVLPGLRRYERARAYADQEIQRMREIDNLLIVSLYDLQNYTDRDV